MNQDSSLTPPPSLVPPSLVPPLSTLQVTTACGAGYVIGEFYDTISPDRGTTCTVRFRVQDVAGRVVAHCHILAHEDGGAMIWMNATGATYDPAALDNPPSGAITCASAGVVTSPAPSARASPSAGTSPAQSPAGVWGQTQ